MITYNIYINRVEVIEDGKCILHSSNQLEQLLHRLSYDLYMAFLHSGFNRGFQLHRASRIINNLVEIVHLHDVDEDNIVSILRELFLFVRRRTFYSINLNIINHV